MSKAKDIRVLLIRAGQTAWDRASRLGGRADLPLAEGEPEAVAELVGSWNGSLDGLSVVVSGPDEASRATASVIAKHAGVKHKSFEKLGELDYGLWEGVLSTDLGERCKSSYRKWLESPADVTPPEGESLGEALDRVAAELGRLLDKAKGDHPVVGVVLRPVVYGLIRGWLSDLPAGDVWKMIESAPNEPEGFAVSPEQIESARERSREHSRARA